MAVVDLQNITDHPAHHWNQLIQVCVDCLLNVNSRLQNMWNCALWQWIRHVLVVLALWLNQRCACGFSIVTVNQTCACGFSIMTVKQTCACGFSIVTVNQACACGFSIVTLTVNQACACGFKDVFLTSAESTQCIQCKYWDVLIVDCFWLGCICCWLCCVQKCELWSRFDFWFSDLCFELDEKNWLNVWFILRRPCAVDGMLKPKNYLIE